MKIGICCCCKTILMDENMLKLYDILLHNGTSTHTKIAEKLFETNKPTKSNLVTISRLIKKLDYLEAIEQYKIGHAVYVKGRSSDLIRKMDVKEI